jgi:6-phospho-3-hexuloisomerase
MHLGFTCHVVGDTTCPSIGEGDLLIVVSGKGDKPSLVSFIDTARRAGAASAAVTMRPESPVGGTADFVMPLEARESQQFGGSLFEQAAMVFFDSVVIALMESCGVTVDQMAAQHSNLE